MLVNIETEYQLDPLEKQFFTKDVSSRFGSLSFLYAKHVWQGIRDLDSLTEPYQESVLAIHTYVKEASLQQIMQ